MFKRNPSRLYRVMSCVFSLLCFLMIVNRPVAAAGSDPNALQESLATSLKGKILMLRNSYCGSSLKFDAQYELVKGGKPGPWTLCRDVRVEDVAVKGGALKISGKRIYWFYDPRQKMFLDVLESDALELEERSKLRWNLKVSIEIPLMAYSDPAQIQAQIDKVFWPAATPPESTAPALWKCFLTPTSAGDKKCPPMQEKAGPRTVQQLARTKANRTEAGSTHPKLRYGPEPNYSDEARALRIRGTGVYAVVVGPDGLVSSVQVTWPLGLGLDEQAAATLSTWKFDPSTKDGVPVAMEISVEMTFNLY